MEKANDKKNAEKRPQFQKHLAEDWQNGKSLTACMEEMYKQSLWTDVTFHCKDHEEGEIIRAHKIVLAARSPVFQAMFFGPCADRKDEFKLKDIEKDAFLLFLRYIYTDSVTMTEENAFAVLEIAHFYQVSSLVHLCADYIATVITSKNACEILRLALFYNLPNLNDECCTFIDNHAQQVLQSDGFMNLSDDSLLYILKGDTFYAKEEDVLEAAEKWSIRKVTESGIKENGENIRKCLGESFYFLRLPTMSYKTLLDSTSRKGYFSIEEYADVAAFSNKVPDKSILTNSCVARVPENETMTLNTQDGELLVWSNMTISFEVSVSRTVLLSSFVLGEIHPYMKNSKDIYTKKGRIDKYIGEVPHGGTFGQSFDHSYIYSCADKAVLITTLDRPRFLNYYYTVLDKLDGFALPDNLGLHLTGSVSISGPDCRQTFELQQLQTEGGSVHLKQPLLLKKRDTPYTVDFQLRYNCGVHLEAKCSGSTESISSETGNIQIRSISGSFSGIKDIGFKNFSNRDEQGIGSEVDGANSDEKERVNEKQ